MPNLDVIRPALERFWTVYVIGEHEVEMRSLGRSVRLSGSGVGDLMTTLLPALDGLRTLEEVRQTLPERLRDEANAVIARLLAQGLLGNASPSEPAGNDVEPGSDEWLRALLHPTSVVEARSRLAHSVVIACGLGPIAEAFVQIVRAVGILTLVMDDPGAVRDSSEALDRIARASLVVAFVAGLRDEGLERVNGASLTTGTPCLPVATDGHEAILGPLVVPGRSACLACVYGRVDALGRTPARLARAGSQPMLPGTAHLLAGLAAAETAKVLLATERPALSGTILRIHLRTLEWTQADVLRLPRCPACAGVRPALLSEQA